MISSLHTLWDLANTEVLPPKSANTSVYLDINRFSERTAWAHGFMHDYALWLGPALLIAVVVASYAVSWWRHAPRAAALLLLGIIGTIVAFGINQVIGHAAKELRPYVTHPHALVLVGRTSDFSFPSDHAVLAGGLTCAVLLLLSREAWPKRPASLDRGATQAPRPVVPTAIKVLAAAIVVFGLFLCFARVYVGAHYPGDVVAGYILGAGVVALFSLLRSLAYRGVSAIEPTILAIALRRPMSATDDSSVQERDAAAVRP